MKVDGVRPTEKFYMALLRATGEGGRTDKTLDILDEMKEIGLKPGVRSYNCAVGACGKVNVIEECSQRVGALCSQCPSFLALMVWLVTVLYECLPIAGDDPLYCSCPHRHDMMYPQAGSWKRAMMLLAEMYVEGMRPAGFAVAATIRACSSAGKWRKGLEVLRQSQQVKPSKPDPCSLGAAIEMCCRAGELVSVLKLLRARRAREPVWRRSGIGTHR